MSFRDLESNDPYIQEETLLTSSEKMETILELKNEPDKKLYVSVIMVLLDAAAGTPDGYIDLIINGEPKLRNFACYEGGVIYYFWGGAGYPSLVFVGKPERPSIIIRVKSNGAGVLTATAMVSGIFVPIKKEEK